MNHPSPRIVCFGEILWDLLPSGKVAGGAPINVACHATQLGIAAQMISKVGDDDLGKHLLDFLKHKGVKTALVQTDYTFPTGVVNVALDANGSPSYEIVTSVAWDYIHANAANKTAVQTADVFVFGSLASRNQTSRKGLMELLELAKLKVFDVNLRSPFYSKGLLVHLLQQADIVKMNDEELEIIGRWLGIIGTEEESAIQVKNHFDLQQLIVTRGAKGVWLFGQDRMINSQGLKIKVQDTIGSGDSFLAAFLSRFLHGELPEKCLRFASTTGAYVATRKGGTPEFSKTQILKFIDSNYGVN